MKRSRPIFDVMRPACILAALLAGMLSPGLSQAQILKTDTRELSGECTYGDCKNGYGVLEVKTPLGTNEYRGDFLEGEFHGFGEYTEMVGRSDRAYYAGNWNRGVREGRGTHWNGIDKLYIGEWKNGKRHGHGSYFFGLSDWRENKHSEEWLRENVENYTGSFRNDLYHGHGTYRWPDGKRYVGGFYANDKHGPGNFYYETGTIRPQVWEYGNFVR